MGRSDVRGEAWRGDARGGGGAARRGGDHRHNHAALSVVSAAQLWTSGPLRRLDPLGPKITLVSLCLLLGLMIGSVP